MPSCDPEYATPHPRAPHRSTLWRSSRTLFAAPHEEIAVCVDALSADAEWLAHRCDDPGAITLVNLATDERSTVVLPEGQEGALFGTVRFSPDQSRIAFATAQGDAGILQSAVAVSDGRGGSTQILSQEESQLIHVAQWIDAKTLLLQIYGATPSVWTVRADGTELAKLTDGTLLGYNFGR